MTVPAMRRGSLRGNCKLRAMEKVTREKMLKNCVKKRTEVEPSPAAANTLYLHTSSEFRIHSQLSTLKHLRVPPEGLLS